MLTRLLAVKRVLDSEAAMMQGRGLASLLDYAKKHPREPWNLADEDDSSGLALLLREAQARKAAQGMEVIR
jgi:hypothetical protein